jgi:hypothetical protein
VAKSGKPDFAVGEGVRDAVPLQIVRGFEHRTAQTVAHLVTADVNDSSRLISQPCCDDRPYEISYICGSATVGIT